MGPPEAYGARSTSMSKIAAAHISVMHVVPMLTPGGMELAMCRVVNALAEEGMRHSVVCLKGEPEIAGRFHPSVTVYCMHAGINEIRLPWRLGRLLLRLRPDVIHARNWSAWPDIAVARTLVATHLPLIYSFHGLDTAGPMPFRRRLASRVLATFTTRIFTVTQASRRMLVDDVGLPASRIEVIPNGVDTDRFRPRAGSRNRDSFVVGTVGSLTPVKNHSALVQACGSLAANGTDLELRIAGEGPERSSLLDLAESLKFTDRLHLHGHVEDVPAFLAGLDIFVLPSDSEAHPNALLEAMACGLPCVATRVGGVPEVLEWGQAGLLVEPGDPSDLAQAINRLAQDRAHRERLGRHARERVVEHYSMSAMLDAYRKLYEAPRGRPSHSAKRALATHRPRVLMLGPTPPATGGMATVVDNLRQSRLAGACRLRVLDNGKTTPEGRSLTIGVAAQLRLFGRIVRVILKHRVQIVHIHTCSGFTFWRDSLHLLVARLLCKAIVLHIHGGWFHEFAAGLGSARKAVLSLALRTADAVLVLGQDWLTKLQQYAPSARWRVVPNGVRVPANPTKAKENSQTTFLFLGSLGELKGASDLVAAASLAARDGLVGDVVIAGPETAPGQRIRLKREARQCNGGVRIRFTGPIHGQDKEAVFDECNCFVLPSYVEGLPMAILEGMAHAMPVIATRVGAIPEAVQEGVEGFLVEPGNPEQLAERMTRIAGNPILRQRMGAAARQRVERDFSLDAMAEKVSGVYNEVLARRRSVR